MLEGFVGGAYTLPALAANHQRCINFLPEIDQKKGKTPSSLIGVPGLRDVITLGPGASKGYIEVNGKLYAAVGQSFGEVSADLATFTALGSFSGTARVTLVSNGLQVLVIDGLSGFVWDIDLMTWTQITDPGFVYGATQADFQDGYGVVALPDSQQFGISGLYNFLVWDAIDFASAEGLPDNVATVVSNNRYLHVLGTNTLELWVNTGGSSLNPFPFERVGGTFFQVGCAAPYSATIADDSVFWLGTNEQGGLGVYRMNGQTPTRVSLVAQEREWVTYETVSDAFGIGIDIGRHPIYMLVFPTADKTWCFDAHSGEWLEWLEWVDVDFKRTRINCFASAFGKLLVGDYRDGRMYEMTFDHFQNGTDVLRSLRMTPYIWGEGKRLFHSRLEVFVQPGIGQNGTAYGSDPEMMMQFSDDGHRWSTEWSEPMGKLGEFDKRVIFNRLGSSRNRMYQIAIDAPVQRTILGASLTAKPGS